MAPGNSPSPTAIVSARFASGMRKSPCSAAERGGARVCRCQGLSAARTQTISQLPEVCRPVCLADSLQHFDRDDKVERAAHVTMVLLAKITVPRPRAITKPLLRELQLLGGKGDPQSRRSRTGPSAARPGRPSRNRSQAPSRRRLGPAYRSRGPAWRLVLLPASAQPCQQARNSTAC